MVYDVSQGSAYAVLYCVLVVFTILGVLPSNVTKIFFSLGSSNNGSEKVDTTTADYFLSARNSAGTTSIALSFFASGMGAWVVYGTTEMGANPQLSWLGVLGYSGASAAPAIAIYFLGPKIREMTNSEKAFSTTSFGRTRYGRVMETTIMVISVFYMFIFIVAELTSISNIYTLVAGSAIEDTDAFALSVAISLGVFTVFYTTVAGLPASLITDKFQGLIMIVLVIVLTIAVTASPENKISNDEFSLASNFTVDGLMAAVTLFIAIISAELFNQATWQRVWAAESIQAMRKGFAIGSLMVFLLMMFFGIMGMIAYAKDPISYDTFAKFAYLSFFDLLEPLPKGWHIIVLLLVTALAASSVDSLQNGIASLVAADVLKLGWNPKWVARLFILLVNIPAIWMASIKYDVIALFLVADLVCATSVFPVFLGLQTTDYGILKAPTELGAFLGCVSGIVTVLINGKVNQADGGLFDYFWLKNEAICALCGSKTMVSFIITPIVSGILTYVFSYLDIMVRGDRAREPLISIPFDNKTATDSDSDTKNATDLKLVSEEQPQEPANENVKAVAV